MFKLLKHSYRSWRADNASQLGAATAYYAIFSLAPFIVLVIAIASVLIDSATVQRELFLQIGTILGDTAADAVKSIVASTQASSKTGLAAVLSILVLFMGASGLMLGLQQSMNHIWKIEANPHTHKLLFIVFKRLLSFGMVVAIGFLFLTSLFITAGVSYTVAYVTDLVPSLKIGLPLLNFTLSFLSTSALFALLFKYLPDINIRWRDVFPGALLTSFLFTIGKFALGFYLGQRDVLSTYGIAGSVILILLWVNYSAQILYFGAEFVREYVKSKGAHVTTKDYAQFMPHAGMVTVVKKEASFPQKLGIVFRVLLFEGRWALTFWRMWRRLKKKDR